MSLPTGTVTFLFTDIEGSTAFSSASATAGMRMSWRNAADYSVPPFGNMAVRKWTAKGMHSSRCSRAH